MEKYKIVKKVIEINFFGVINKIIPLFKFFWEYFLHTRMGGLGQACLLCEAPPHEV